MASEYLLLEKLKGHLNSEWLKDLVTEYDDDFVGKRACGCDQPSCRGPSIDVENAD